MRQKLIYFRFFCLAAILFAVSALPNEVLSQPIIARVYVDPASSVATTCTSHTIDIQVDNVTDLIGYDLLIRFDPGIVEVLDVQESTFLDSPGVGVLYPPTNLQPADLANGIIRFGLTQQRTSSSEVDPKSGAGDLIHITLKALVPNAATDIEIDENESTLVNWPDASEIAFTVDNGLVDTSSCPPTGIDLSKFSLPENEPVGTEVGIFATTDPDPGDSFTYTLVNSGAYPDNASFEIVGDRLITLESFNYEEKSSYEIKVRSTDFGGLWIEETFTITIVDVNDRPIAFDQAVFTQEGQSVDIQLTGFDEDGDTLSFSLTDLPDYGTLSGSLPNLTYTPQEGYVGDDSFSFTVSDGELTSEPAVVTISMDKKQLSAYWFPIFQHSEN